MKRKNDRHGTNAFAQTNKNKGGISLQNYYLEPNLYHYYRQQQSTDDLQIKSNYETSSYLSALNASGSQKHNEMLYYSQMDDSIDFNESSFLYPMYFEDIFYCRNMHQAEEQELRTKEPHKFFA